MIDPRTKLPNLMISTSPLLYVLVSIDGKLFIAPAIMLGRMTAVFTEQKKYEAIAVVHKDKVRNFFPTIPGAMGSYAETANYNAANQLYCICNNLFIADTFRLFDESSNPDEAGLKQELVDWLAAVAAALYASGTKLHLVGFELQQFVGNILFEVGMEDLIYAIAASFESALQKFYQNIDDPVSFSPDTLSDENNDFLRSLLQ